MMPKQPKRDPKGQAGAPSWKRFNDEIFSLRTCAGAATDPLVRQLAAEGVELVVDARRGGAKNVDMEADCEGAGVYYVPAPGHESGPTPSAEVAARYVKLAMRHKTCFVVDGDSDELLTLVSEQMPFTTVPLGHEAGPPPSA